jgi:HPt (histidine-containing phosphotransfer) domain-containing protein
VVSCSTLPNSESEDLSSLSDKGHFLKGSSAAIGIKKVQKSCEEIQNYGKLLGAEGTSTISREQALKLLGEVLVRVREEYDDVKKWLDNYFNQP